MGLSVIMSSNGCVGWRWSIASSAGHGDERAGWLGPLRMVEGERPPLILRRIKSYDPDWPSSDDYTIHVDEGVDYTLSPEDIRELVAEFPDEKQ
jgi:hypothetical protein